MRLFEIISISRHLKTQYSIHEYAIIQCVDNIHTRNNYGYETAAVPVTVTPNLFINHKNVARLRHMYLS